MKKLFFVMVTLFVTIQFYRPYKNVSLVENHNDFLIQENVPKNIAKIFKKSCYDCHSNNTNYAWYDNIAPISWYVDSKVKRGKLSLNFSKWGTFESWQRRLFLQGAIQRH